MTEAEYKDVWFVNLGRNSGGVGMEDDNLVFEMFEAAKK